MQQFTVGGWGLVVGGVLLRGAVQQRGLRAIGGETELSSANDPTNMKRRSGGRKSGVQHCVAAQRIATHRCTQMVLAMRQSE